ncbi:MAG: trypsin-like serine protease [Kofleriaceae bacterium]
MSKRVLLLSVILASGPAFAGTLDSPIVGGTPTTVGQYPNVVSIDAGSGMNQGLCTGTLITPDWVLTAAHCVLPSELGVTTQAAVTATIKVHVGTVSDFSGGTVYTAQDSMPDPAFNINAIGSHDSGLIHLSMPVTGVQPAPLNFDPAAAPIGITVTMVGFGLTSGTGNSAGIEHVVDQTSVACTSMEGSDANLLCFSQVNGKGKCNGDSGGPSFAMIGGRLVEVGITSFGDQTCSQYGADTRVDAEKAFIIAHVPNLQCETDADCTVANHECFAHTCIVTPYTTTGVGADCTGNADCDSGTCGTEGTNSKCTMVCAIGTDGACPADLSCVSDGNGGGLCFPAEGGGCCDASGHGAPTSLLGIALVGLVLRRKKR